MKSENFSPREILSTREELLPREKSAPDWEIEEECFARGYTVIAGTDEAGRGPLAGHVFAAVCVLPRKILLPKLNDSKKLTAHIREKLYDAITNAAVTYGIAFATPEEIDALNI